MWTLEEKDNEEEKKTTPQEWILCILSEKEEILINKELIGVTTKSWSSFHEMWWYHNSPQFTMMKKWMMT